MSRNDGQLAEADSIYRDALQGRFDEAEPLLAAADSMYTTAYGEEHYLTQRTRGFVSDMGEKMSASQHPVRSLQ